MTQAEAELKISPMCPALHYGQQAFEGLKAFETYHGDVNIFHPDDANADRLNTSCARMCMPEVCCVRSLVYAWLSVRSLVYAWLSVAVINTR